jgi:DNA-binding transcriptional ArsR family regulator
MTFALEVALNGWIEQVLGSEPRVRVLRVLSWTDEEVTGREVHARAGSLAGEAPHSLSSVQRALERLVDAEIVSRRAIGRLHLYRLRREERSVRHLLLPLLQADLPPEMDPITALAARLRPAAAELRVDSLTLAPWRQGQAVGACLIPLGYLADPSPLVLELRAAAEPVLSALGTEMEVRTVSLASLPHGDALFEERFLREGIPVHGRTLADLMRR